MVIKFPLEINRPHLRRNLSISRLARHMILLNYIEISLFLRNYPVYPI
ncbi:hypothetical protein CI610_03531 [invertebrate metagenome]|uniref:Uncharacterized protein n=1 Tax=invertebrate metagenome TaxID=1711999 RepID=A0A2H9T2X4_9ZZZZ